MLPIHSDRLLIREELQTNKVQRDE